MSQQRRPSCIYVYCSTLKRRVQRSELWELLSSSQPLSFHCPEMSCRVPLRVHKIYPHGTSRGVHITTKPGLAHKPGCPENPKAQNHRFKRSGPQENLKVVPAPDLHLNLTFSTSHPTRQRLEILIQNYLEQRAS